MYHIIWYITTITTGTYNQRKLDVKVHSINRTHRGVGGMEAATIRQISSIKLVCQIHTRR
jgi:hypothetical protein